MPRLLQNWLTTFGEWTVPRSEAPESFILWNGLFTLASIARRNVKFPKSIMGSYDIYPNLYIIYIGPPGVVRKSTTVHYSEALLQQLDYINIASTAVSQSELVELLSDTNDGAITILSSEFASFVSVSEGKMYDFLTDVYDGKLKYEYATRSYGKEIVKAPCINMLAATTPQWVNENMPTYVIGGGFASRTIFIYGNKVRRRKLYYDIDWKEYEEVEKRLIHDLRLISTLKGEFRHDSEETKDWVEDWYQTFADSGPEGDKLEGYMSRRHLHLHKVAMLLSLSERDDLVVTRPHFEVAIRMLEEIQEKLSRVFSAVGRNPYAADLDAIYDYIADNEKVSFSRLLSRFYHNLGKAQLQEILDGLKALDRVERVPNCEGPIYRVKKEA